MTTILKRKENGEGSKGEEGKTAMNDNGNNEHKQIGTKTERES